MKSIFSVFLLVLISFAVFAQDNNANTQNWKAVDDAAAQKLKKYNKYKIIRTSKDTNLLKSYIDLYKHNGGELYIIMLQQTYKLKKEADTAYKLILTPADEAEMGPHPKWSDFMYCPIGKENGTIIVMTDEGVKMQEWHYTNERKNGKILWYNEDNTISNTFIYRNDTLMQKR